MLLFWGQRPQTPRCQGPLVCLTQLPEGEALLLGQRPQTPLRLGPLAAAPPGRALAPAGRGSGQSVRGKRGSASGSGRRTVMAAARADGFDLDLVIRGGTIYDGSGAPPYAGDLAVRGDTIVAVGPAGGGLAGAGGRRARSTPAACAVAPGFVNMMGKESEPVRRRAGAERRPSGRDPRSLRRRHLARPAERRHAGRAGQWRGRRPPPAPPGRRSARGSSTWWRAASRPTWPRSSAPPRCAATCSAKTTSPRPPAQLQQMRDLVRQAMEEGAMGLGSALIYVPGCFATTAELIALAEVVAAARGHLHLPPAQRGRALRRGRRRAADHRPAGRLRRGDLPPQGHRPGQLAQAARRSSPTSRPPGRRGWRSRRTCTPTPPARPASTPRCRRGCARAGHRAWVARLQDPAVRERLRAGDGRAGGRLGEPPAERRRGERPAGRLPQPGPAPPDRDDPGRRWPPGGARRRPKRPWTWWSRTTAASAPSTSPCPRTTCAGRSACPGSASAPIRRRWRRKASSCASGVHPRAYGTFARLLGSYVREERPHPAGSRRCAAWPPCRRPPSSSTGGEPCARATSPTSSSSIRPRSQDHATFERPHQYATGDAPRAGERHAGAARRRAHRGDAGAGRARPGLAGVRRG